MKIPRLRFVPSRKLVSSFSSSSSRPADRIQTERTGQRYSHFYLHTRPARRWLHSALPSLSLSRWVHVRLHERILNGPRGPWSVPVRYSQAITTIGYTPIKPGASRDLLAMHRVQVSWKAVRVAKRLSWKSCPFFLRFFSLSRSLSLALALCLPSRDVSHSNCSVSTRHEARPRSVFYSLSLLLSFLLSFFFF